jgi:hypothetical protein
VPLLYLTGFVTDDRAINKLSDGVTTKSKNLYGVRGSCSTRSARRRRSSAASARSCGATRMPSRARPRWRRARHVTAR